MLTYLYSSSFKPVLKPWSGWKSGLRPRPERTQKSKERITSLNKTYPCKSKESGRSAFRQISCFFPFLVVAYQYHHFLHQPFPLTQSSYTLHLVCCRQHVSSYCKHSDRSDWTTKTMWWRRTSWSKQTFSSFPSFGSPDSNSTRTPTQTGTEMEWNDKQLFTWVYIIDSTLTFS